MISNTIKKLAHMIYAGDVKKFYHVTPQTSIYDHPMFSITFEIIFSPGTKASDLDKYIKELDNIPDTLKPAFEKQHTVSKGYVTIFGRSNTSFSLNYNVITGDQEYDVDDYEKVSIAIETVLEKKQWELKS
jgi:hypothetical protein